MSGRWLPCPAFPLPQTTRGVNLRASAREDTSPPTFLHNPDTLHPRSGTVPGSVTCALPPPETKLLIRMHAGRCVGRATYTTVVKDEVSMAGKGEGAKASPSEGSTTVPPTRAVGSETATGLQLAHERGEQEVPKGAERGSQVEIEGGDPTPDAEGPQKPRGLQAESALFVSNGSISSTDVPSPSGLQPIGAVATSVEHGRQLVEDKKREHQKFVSRSPRAEALEDAQVQTMGRAELKALGQQRGYDMPDAGTRATRAAFLAAQDKDQTLGGGEMGSKRGGAGVSDANKSSKGSQQARGSQSSKASLSKATKRAAPKGGATRGGGGKGSRGK